MELAGEIYNHILALSEQGDNYAENNEFDAAIDQYQEALNLLPEPKSDWEASTWLYVALGDALFSENRMLEARNAYEAALKSPDGSENPYIWFCLGEVFFSLGDQASAGNNFQMAYQLDGLNIFEGQNPAYLTLIGIELTDD